MKAERWIDDVKREMFYLLLVVKKFSMVVTPSVTRAGSAFHSIQKVTKEEVTRIIPAHTNNLSFLSQCL